MQDYISDFFGIKTATLIAAFLGSAVSLSYMPQLTRWQLFSSIFTGTAIAVYGAPFVLHFFDTPEVLERGVAFFAGLIAMRAVPVLFYIVDRFKGLKLPVLPDDSKE